MAEGMVRRRSGMLRHQAMRDLWDRGVISLPPLRRRAARASARVCVSRRASTACRARACVGVLPAAA